MDVMSSPATALHNKLIIDYVSQHFPEVQIASADHSYWNPESRTIYISKTAEQPDYSLMHELGHIMSQHTTYKSDVSLLRMEVEAWARARSLAAELGMTIDTEHIEDCMDSYRDWLHKRSTCPACTQTGVQSKHGAYSCLNCGKSWRVSMSRFCRSYRIQK